MEDGQFNKLLGWFETLSKKMETMATSEQFSKLDQKFENRFQMLATSMINLDKRVRSYHDQQSEEILVLRHALHDMGREFKDLYEKVHHS